MWLMNHIFTQSELYVYLVNSVWILFYLPFHAIFLEMPLEKMPYQVKTCTLDRPSALFIGKQT